MNDTNRDSGFYLRRGIKRMNEAVSKIPPLSQGSGDADILISELSLLKEDLIARAAEGLSDMEKGLDLDPGNFNTDSIVKDAVSNINDMELLDIFAAIERNKPEYALEELSKVIKRNPENRNAGELYERVRYGFCWFCRNEKRLRKPFPAAALKILLHKTGDPETGGTSRQQMEIRIPRCSNCEAFHSHDYRIGAGAGLVAGLLINTAAWLYAGNFDILYFLTVILSTTAAGTLFHSIWSGISRFTTHPLKHSDRFPPLMKREMEGWEMEGGGI